jgi:hypothetical protein
VSAFIDPPPDDKNGDLAKYERTTRISDLGAAGRVDFPSEKWLQESNRSLEDALADVKRRFRLPEDSEHDVFLLGLLRRRLTRQGDQLVWPRGVRSALVFWDGESS